MFGAQDLSREGGGKDFSVTGAAKGNAPSQGRCTALYTQTCSPAELSGLFEAALPEAPAGVRRWAAQCMSLSLLPHFLSPKAESEKARKKPR